jgi:hypothetical protein
MSTVYELMDVESANLIGTYESETEALSVVRAAVAAHGKVAIDGIALGYEDEKGNGAMIAKGAELVARALSMDPKSFPQTA